FLQELFTDDIVRERVERAEMMTRVRTRALTLPPTDELRQLVERSDKATLPPELYAGGDLTAETPVRRPGSIGRRSSDRGEEGDDRRRQADRRAAGRASGPALDRGAA